MLNDPPARLNPGDPITANWLNSLLDSVRANIPREGPGITATRDSSGTTLAIRQTPQTANPPTPAPETMPKFLCPAKSSKKEGDPSWFDNALVVEISHGHISNKYFEPYRFTAQASNSRQFITIGVKTNANWAATDENSTPPPVEQIAVGIHTEGADWEWSFHNGTGYNQNASVADAYALIGTIYDGKVETLNVHNKQLAATGWLYGTPAEEAEFKSYLYNQTKDAGNRTGGDEDTSLRGTWEQKGNPMEGTQDGSTWSQDSTNKITGTLELAGQLYLPDSEVGGSLKAKVIPIFQLLNA